MEFTGTKSPGACFAPPLTEELLRGYEEIVDAQPAGPLKDALQVCLTAVKAWWSLPESKATPVKHPFHIEGDLSKPPVEIPITPLEDSLIAELDKSVPWPHELAGLRILFGELPGGDVRNAAHHLFWHVEHLSVDREPPTTDLLKELPLFKRN